MALRTASSQDPPVGRSRLIRAPCEGRGRVEPFIMTLLAQSRRPDPKQPDGIAAMRLVAVQAALANRRVLPQERPPFIRVAAVTEFIDAILGDQFFGDRPMRVMAVRALEFALADGHVGPIHLLGIKRSVTLLAERHLVRGVELGSCGLR